jgi:hypothetical protein
LVVSALPTINVLFDREEIKALEQDNVKIVAFAVTNKLLVRVVPATSKLFEGLVVLIPTKPELSIHTRLLPLVTSPSLLKSGRYIPVVGLINQLKLGAVVLPPSVASNLVARMFPFT